MADRRLFPDDVHPALVGANVSARARDGDGHPCLVGLRLGDLALPGAGLHSPIVDGKLG